MALDLTKITKIADDGLCRREAERLRYTDEQAYIHKQQIIAKKAVIMSIVDEFINTYIPNGGTTLDWQIQDDNNVATVYVNFPFNLKSYTECNKLQDYMGCDELQNWQYFSEELSKRLKPARIDWNNGLNIYKTYGCTQNEYEIYYFNKGDNIALTLYIPRNL